MERVTNFDTSVVGKVRFEGNEVAASKLSQMVGEGSNVASAVMRLTTRMINRRAGEMIRTVVTMGRRFCSNQCFHNNSANCPAFDIAMLSPVADAVLLVSTHTHTHSFSFLFVLGLGWVALG